MNYDAVLFDNDGVLLTLNHDIEVFRSMIRDTFREFGVTDPGMDEVAAFMGSLDIPEMRSICNSYNVELEEFWRSREMRSSSIQREMILDGERYLYSDVDALDRLEDAGLAVVSNNQHRTVEHVLSYYELSCFDSYYGREPTVEGIKRMKPRPYYLEQALDDLGTRNAVFVGDNESDILAAGAAGIDSVFVERQHTTELAHESTYRVDDLHELVDLVKG